MPRWSFPTRVAFRFSFAYLGLYAVATQILGGLLLFPNISFPAMGTQWPMRNITIWVAGHLFRISSPLVYTGNSGDTAFYWVQTFWLLVAAAVATIVWSDLDRRRADYVTLHKWFRLFVRFALAAQMFDYGMAKVIPTQFPPPSLVTLVEPLGNLSLTDLLWTSVGASTSYQIFTGWAEMLAGLLLLVPSTTLLGALVALADMVLVFMLNMAYDFGLKQISFHLILMSLFLVAPDTRRLLDLFFFNRPAPASAQPSLLSTPRGNRLLFYGQIVFSVYLLAMYAHIGYNYWYSPGGRGSPKSPLYGIWDVRQLAVDGQTRSPLLNDYDQRWRRLIFDGPDSAVFQRTDDSFAHYGASVDAERRSIALTKGNSRTWGARFTFERPAADRLILDGEMDTHTIHIELELVDLDTFRLLNSRFRLIRPPDPSGG